MHRCCDRSGRLRGDKKLRAKMTVKAVCKGAAAEIYRRANHTAEIDGDTGAW
jgi:hypothetical protein